MSPLAEFMRRAIFAVGASEFSLTPVRWVNVCAKSGSEIFISVTGPYFAAASRILAASPTSTMTRSPGRGNASAVTAAVSARSTFTSAGP